MSMSSLHPRAMEGIHAFNQGDFFEAHELLEEAWLAEPGQLRNLYRGMLQAAVVYLHITRNNYEGAVKVYGRSQKWLAGWPDIVLGLDVSRLKTDLEAAIAEAQRLGPGQLDQFDKALFKPLLLDERSNQ